MNLIISHLGFNHMRILTLFPLSHYHILISGIL
nr:MAG TPA: hypothetical protein [Caudoviricetes sp.]